MIQLRYGKTPARPDSIKLKFSDYLVRPKLPAVPAKFGHVRNTPPAGGWGMLGNDKAGDCVIAGAMHETMIWHEAGRKNAVVFTEKAALHCYSMALVAEGRPAYNPNDPMTDTGLDMQKAAKWRVNHGVTDANGNTHKIAAYVAINDLENLLLAAYLFGAAGMGLALPDNADQQFLDGQIWDDTSGRPANGHYVSLVGRNSRGNLIVSTWGDLQGMTPQYAHKYMDEAVAYLSMDYILDNGKSPESFDVKALQEDLAALRAK